MKKYILSGTVIVCLVSIATLILLWNYPNNSVNRLRKEIGLIDEFKVFPLPNDGENPLFTTRDDRVIQKFFDAIEFERVSPRQVVRVKMPGTLEFVAMGGTTRRLQWVASGWGYLRADTGLLSGDVQLTERSSDQLADWLKGQGIKVPARGTEGSSGSEPSNP